MSPKTNGKAEMANVEEVSSATSMPRKPTTFGGKVKAHFRRFWWVHLILFLAGVIIVSVCLCYVAFPRIAQNGINSSTLIVNSLELSNPTSNGFHLTQNSTIINNTPYHPRLDSFNASLSLRGGDAYAYVELPALHATQSGTNLIDQDVTLADPAAFTAYNVAVLNDESVQVDVNGSTRLHEMKFPDTTVAYNTTTTMNGLNKFPGFNITSFSVKLPADPVDGANMIGEVYIPNPSVLTLHMGNVTFANYLPATPFSPAVPIGNTTIADLVLRPGNNTVPMRSTVNQTLIIQAIAVVYKDGIVPVDIVGNTSVYNGQHLPYFEAALQSLTQHVRLDVNTALKQAGLDPALLVAGALGQKSPPARRREKRD